MINKINVSIVGSTGYSGEELHRILHNHPNVAIKHVTSVTFTEQKFNNVYTNFRKRTEIVCSNESLSQLAVDSDVVFLALPHGLALKEIDEEILKKTKIIDLGADFRLKDKTVYEKWYKVEHNSPDLLKQAVYGLSEIYRNDIKQSNLIANPGCYTTCSILSLYPLVKENIIDVNTIIIDAKSGVSGAGRTTAQDKSFVEMNENFKAYNIAGGHRHTPEIEQELSIFSGKEVILSFNPQLIPVNRGIYAMCYAKLNKQMDEKQIMDIYNKYYENEYFVRIVDGIPEIRSVKGSNFVDIGFKIDLRTNTIVVIGTLDNLVKGAAGQAIQNMNIMFGFKEQEGLETVGFYM
jgi:N-acetyl-gamma-glutamyl-phosphate reductase